MRTICALSVCCLLFFSCTKDKAGQVIPVDCTAINAEYTADIVPIIQASCITGAGPGTGCHDSWILNYNSLKSQVDNGNITEVVYEFRTMPPQPNSFGIPRLTDDEINKIVCWIKQGAPEN